MGRFMDADVVKKVLTTSVIINEKKYSLKSARNACERTFYKNNHCIDLNEYDLSHEVAVNTFIEQSKKDGTAWRVADQLNNSLRGKKFRIKKRIKKMYYWHELAGYGLLFLTLTFTDETLNKTSYDTRLQYVRRYLSKYCVDFVANVDYGKQNDREHYHAVVLIDGKLPFDKWHKYGAIHCERFNDNADNDDLNRVSSYIDKLVNHGLKDSTQHKLIYGRCREMGL